MGEIEHPCDTCIFQAGLGYNRDCIEYHNIEECPNIARLNPPKILVINLNQKWDYCCICDKVVYNKLKGIPMYEGIPVPPDWEGDWGGKCACDECFDKYEKGELQTW